MLLDQLAPRAIVLADKAYDANRIRELIQDQGAAPNIPLKNNPCRKPSPTCAVGGGIRLFFVVLSHPT
jgi:hypothetical protein